ncbi:GNAT family N-acetyltransferase [Azohydromonas aeria]|uniref:GNAT family N-acetyltransferase n=1 Tax=Azohydromonas aeria TaxID=2590212 RepID=UPI0012FA886E|nr:GNAT family N-acetyltransferase [Azohydromonas aeria]
MSATPPAYRIEVLRHPGEFPDDVRALFDVVQAQAQAVESSLAWYRNLLDTLPTLAAHARFYVLRRGSEVRAVLPLLAGEPDAPAPGRVQSLANYYTALYAPLCAAGADADDFVPLIRAVVHAHAPLHRLRLQPMDPRSAGFGALSRALRRCGLMPFAFHCFGNWFLPCAGLPWERYLAERPGALRSTIRRAQRKLERVGARVEIVTGGQRLPEAIAAWEQVYAASWKQPEPHPAFMPGLIATSARQGWLRLGLVWLDGHPIAAQLWLVAAGKASIYKLAYDQAFAAFAPGTVLTAQLMRHVLEQDRVVEVDYLMGDDAYKRDWMSERRERWGLVAYNLRTLPGAAAALREGLARAAKPLLRRPCWRSPARQD